MNRANRIAVSTDGDGPASPCHRVDHQSPERRYAAGASGSYKASSSSCEPPEYAGSHRTADPTGTLPTASTTPTTSAKSTSRHVITRGHRGGFASRERRMGNRSGRRRPGDVPPGRVCAGRCSGTCSGRPGAPTSENRGRWHGGRQDRRVASGARRKAIWGRGNAGHGRGRGIRVRRSSIPVRRWSVQGRRGAIHGRRRTICVRRKSILVRRKAIVVRRNDSGAWGWDRSAAGPRAETPCFGGASGVRMARAGRLALLATVC